MSGRSQFTVTFGREGQVVRRGGAVSDGDRSDVGPWVGAKRSIMERLGSNSDSSYLSEGASRSKRQRRGRYDDIDDDRQSIHNHRIGRDDLRFKLIHKNQLRRPHTDVVEHNGRDLRETLSRTSRVLSRSDARDPIPDSRSSFHSRRIPPTRSANDLLHMDSQRKCFSGWNLEGLRRRSPDRLLGASRGLSPPRRIDDTHRVSSIRSSDPSRPATYMAHSVTDSSRAVPYMTKPTVPGQSSKSLVRLPPLNSAAPKSSYPADEQPTVSDLLHSLGLGKYAILFQAEEVDMTALKQMSDNDLKELGIPMGPRKKILLAVAPRAKQRHA